MEPELAAPALQIDQLTVRFDGRTVIDGFSLRLGRGERAIITGDSGAGKSTVLRCIFGFVSSFEGRVAVDGEAVSVASIWALRARMSYVTQEPQLGTGTVQEVLERPFSYRVNAGLRSGLSRIPELLDRLLLPADLLHKDMGVLSGGEKQRVALAAAFLLGRRIMLLDEPTSALDKSARAAVAGLLSADSGLTVLAAAHDAGDLPLSGTVVSLPGGSRG